jgi:plasmid stabilization system protein ParE
MAKEVVLMPLALANYDIILDYLLSEWTEKIANDFVKRFNQVCNILLESPDIYPYTDKVKNVQRCVLTKHNVIYFVVTPDAIKILAIFDSRQNPERLLGIF